MNVESQIEDAVFDGKTDKVEELIAKNSSIRNDAKRMNFWLQIAARNDDIPMLKLFVKMGIDINFPDAVTSEGAICGAASGGALGAVKFLLKQHAIINRVVDGQERCFSLIGAIQGGHLDVVKALVEHGAGLNAVWIDQNALSTAVAYDQKEIEKYLRSKGAVKPGGSRASGKKNATPKLEKNDLFGHIKNYLGTPKKLSLQNIVTSKPNIQIHACEMSDCIALVTTGMSELPMTVPKDAADLRYAELIMYLPKKWPLSDVALKKTEYSWPLQWMRRIALYPHQKGTWLGGKAVIFSNGEPPKPFASDTKHSCILAITKKGDFDCFERSDGNITQFYSLYALYKEERAIETRDGIETLLKALEHNNTSHILDLKRKNVGIK